MSPIRAIHFDFDGVLADTEPLHFQMFQEVLQGEGVTLLKEDYYARYLGLDDASCFQQVFTDRGLTLDVPQRDRLIQSKNQKVLKALASRNFLMPGVPELLKVLHEKYYLTVVSGALKSEVNKALQGGGVETCFRLVIGAEDVKQCKPDPEGYLLALKLLNRDHVPAADILLPHECAIVEDSPWGIQSARGAGMPCIGVTHSYPRDHLKDATRVIDSLSEITPDLLAALST